MRKLWTFFFSISIYAAAWSQCSLEGPFPIENFAVFDLAIQIDSLVNDDLSDPQQGLCAVAIEFEHDLVGDVLIELESPAGQVVTLIGPTGPFSFTQGTQWDISFVPCASNAQPDLGFGDVYSNLNLWGNFANHSGSYYPYSGCLEDFNTGSANGVWKVSVRDAGQFYEGQIDRISLFFCDPTGINCQNCTAPELENLQDSVKLCLLDSLPDSLWVESNAFDSNLHDIRYLLSQEDSLISVESEYPFTPSLAPDTYNLCALSWEKSDSSNLEGLLDTSVFINDFIHAADSLGLCYNLTNCVVLIIEDGPDTIQEDALLCPGDTLFWRSLVLTEAGQYQVTDSSDCVTVFQLDLDTVSFPQTLVYPDTFNCQVDSVPVEVIPFDSVQYQYQWIVNETDTVFNQFAVGIRSTDRLQLVVSLGTCSQTFVSNVPYDTIPPTYIVAFLDSLNCLTDSTILTLSHDGLQSTIFYRNDTFTGNQVSVIDTQWIELRIEGQNQCVVIDSFRAPFNFTPPFVQIDTNVTFCPGDAIPLRALGIADTYQWVGPNGFSSNRKDTSTFDEGTYVLMSLDSTSYCETIDSFLFLYPSDITLPEVSADTLSCIQPSVQLKVDPLEAGLFYQWIEPTGDTIVFPTPFVSRPGIYTLVINNSGNCVKEIDLEVLQEDNLDSFSIVEDTLDCDVLFVRLYTNLPKGELVDSLLWINPLGDTVQTDTLNTALPGLYIARLSTSSGCAFLDSFELQEDFTPFAHQLTADTISCKRDSAEISINGPPTYLYQWVDARGDSISQDQNFKVNQAGVYFVTIESPACQYVRAIRVLADTLDPDPPLLIKNRDCINDSVGVDLNSPHIQWAFWDENQASFQEIDSDRYRALGIDSITLQFTGSNGCSSIQTIEFSTDTLSVDISIETDTIDCNSTGIGAYVQRPDSLLQVSWQVNQTDRVFRDSVIIALGDDLRVFWAGKNGCQDSSMVVIPADTLLPFLDLELPELNCTLMSDTLQVPLRPVYDSISWSAPGAMPFIIQDSVIVDRPGLYEAILYGRNGCVVMQEFEMVLDTQIIYPEIQSDTLQCNERVRQFITSFDTSQLNSFQWYQEGLPIDSSIFANFPTGNYLLEWQMDNTCKDSLEFNLSAHSFTASITTLPQALTLNCTQPVTLLTVDSIPSVRKYQWILPSGMSIESNQWEVNENGTFLFVAEDRNFCLDSQTINVVLDTVTPDLTTEDGFINCRTPFDSLRVEVVPSSRIQGLIWTGPNGYVSEERIPLVIDSGLYMVQVTLDNGCSSADSLVVEADFRAPELNLPDSAYFNCSTMLATLEVQNSLVQNLWYRGDSFLSDLPRIQVEQPGTYIVIGEGFNGCITRDTIEVAETLPFPKIEWDIPELNCQRSSDSIRIEGLLDPDLEFSWEGPNGFLSEVSQPFVVDTGTYIVRYINLFDCISTDTLEVRGVNLPPEVEWRILDTARCLDSTHLVEIFLNDGGPSESILTALSGNVGLTSEPNVYQCAGPGQYVWEVIRQGETCIVMDSFTLSTPLQDEPQVDVAVTPLWCERDTQGSISLSAKADFRAPFQYRLDNQSFDSIATFTPLLEGVYTWTVVDRFGCETSGSSEVENLSAGTQFDLGPDIRTVPGEELIFRPTTNVDTTQFVGWNWIFNGTQTCDTCRQYRQRVSGPFRLEAQWITKGGCLFMDEVLVNVPTDQILFVPNVFTPDENGINDFFYIQSSTDIEFVELVQVYDRWGNRVYECRDCPVNDITSGWDGTFEGEPMFPQVLAVLIIYEFEGERVTEYLDLTLIR
jgi:gliding motility-associated-like protein